MKLFIVQSHLGGGGAERVGVLLANGFATRGHDVYIITNLHDAVDYEVDANVRILNMVSSTNNNVLKWFGSIRNLRRYVKRINPDVVIGIMQLSSFISRIACIRTNSHVIMTEHGTFQRPESAPFSKFNYFCKYYLNKIYECITVITQADKDYIRNRLKNVVVMPNPLLLSQVVKIPSKKRILLAAGRLDDWHYKGFDVLIRAWARVVSSLEFLVSTDGWKLQIAGTGNEESLNYLKQLCKDNGVGDYVEFLGFRKDVEKLYQDASIFVLSSRYEGFGLVLIEAMSQGCACIACDYKGRQREIIAPHEGECLDSSLKFQDSSVDGQKESEDTSVSNSKISQKQETAEGPQTRNFKPDTQNIPLEACETGILCEPDNVEALADAMTKMITDDEYRESVRRNAIERSKYYSLDNTMDRWESLITQSVS